MFNGSNNVEILIMSSNFLKYVPKNLPPALYKLHLKVMQPASRVFFHLGHRPTCVQNPNCWASPFQFTWKNSQAHCYNWLAKFGLYEKQGWGQLISPVLTTWEVMVLLQCSKLLFAGNKMSFLCFQGSLLQMLAGRLAGLTPACTQTPGKPWIGAAQVFSHYSDLEGSHIGMRR